MVRARFPTMDVVLAVRLINCSRRHRYCYLNRRIDFFFSFLSNRQCNNHRRCFGIYLVDDTLLIYRRWWYAIDDLLIYFRRCNNNLSAILLRYLIEFSDSMNIRLNFTFHSIQFGNFSNTYYYYYYYFDRANLMRCSLIEC